MFSSRQLVNWYNGSLDSNESFNKEIGLESVKDVVIIGNGNVAMDISRVLLKNPDLMAPFDMPTSVVETLKKSQIKNI